MASKSIRQSGWCCDEVDIGAAADWVPTGVAGVFGATVAMLNGTFLAGSAGAATGGRIGRFACILKIVQAGTISIENITAVHATCCTEGL